MNSYQKSGSHRIAVARGRGVGGTTLVEMMVAIAVTIIMMAVAGVVFKNAIDASGSATATGEIMATARGITQQLERDFSGLRTDMPMAIIFEAENETAPGFRDGLRHDRIVFFSDGDFQATDGGGLSGNLARIFYGQTTDNSGGFGWLARRFKIMTSDTSDPALLLDLDPSTNAWPTSELYDYNLFEIATAADWKNISSLASNSISGFPDNFINYYFNDEWHPNLPETPIAYNAEVSFIHRPNIDWVLTGDAIQRLYMAGYIGEFKIQVYFRELSDWRPWTAWDYHISPIALYWNVDDLGNPTMIPLNNGQTSGWYSGADNIFGVTQVWPDAIKFTFTLYEKNMKYYPDGQTFSYIVKLKQR